jgi:hypothetical protein
MSPLRHIKGLTSGRGIDQADTGLIGFIVNRHDSTLIRAKRSATSSARIKF